MRIEGQQLSQQTNTSPSGAYCPHSCAPQENFPGGHPSQDYSQPNTLNYEVFLAYELPKRKMHLVDISSISNSFKAIMRGITNTLQEFNWVGGTIQYALKRS